MSEPRDKNAKSDRERDPQRQASETNAEPPTHCSEINLSAVYDGDQLVGLTAVNERGEELTVTIRVVDMHGDACCSDGGGGWISC